MTFEEKGAIVTVIANNENTCKDIFKIELECIEYDKDGNPSIFKVPDGAFDEIRKEKWVRDILHGYWAFDAIR